ncbi:hypothetical protein KDW_41320 [Dictyobacter vulcani]|uniref:HNH nuclease domain-containing protein n=1 Tax=Dictyobacter vulcani TaxID=2607529 RepID=A0A5J4KU40_9CHLR|nr:hypothetical protein KDW_41320 [Dictyobacter vulcani]
MSYSYKNTCTQGATNPCLELDTTTRQVSGGTQTVTTQQWFDGQGRVVETKAPGPNLWSKVPKIPSTLITYTLYDTMGRATTKSLPYAISALAGTGYIAPNLAQARTVTNYDGLGRALGSATYQDASTIVLSSSVAYTVAQGLPSFNQSTTLPFERTTTLDAYNHQAVSYTDAIGRQRYNQVFKGNGAPYTVLRTIRYDRDVVGNLYATLTYDASTAQLASQQATYDGVGRKIGMNDSDSGSNWVFSYDQNSNPISQTDPRSKSVYINYDVLNRPLCKGTTSAAVNPCTASATSTFFYDSYDKTSNPGVTFPSACTAPSGSYASDPIGAMTAETFSGVAGAGSRCKGYDERGRIDQSGLTVNGDGQTITQTMNMSYNDAGQPTSVVYPDGETVTAQYDSNGYSRSAFFGTPASTDPVNFLVGQVSYTNTGQVAGLAFGGSAAKSSVPAPVFSTTMGYDGIQRPVSSSATNAGGTFWNQNRTYDNVGNVLGVSTTLPTTTGGTQKDVQSFCYDSLNRLVWSGNTGAPSGGDHCGLAPAGTTLATYQQSYSYDALDRLTSGPSGTETYGFAPVHGALTLSTVPGQYASYDAMGNMTCRNVDTTTAHACDGSQTGAQLTYDNEGRLETWTAPSGTTASDQYLYDNSGQRVFQHSSSTLAGNTTKMDTITFDGTTDVTTTNGVTSTTKYYSVGGQRVAMKKDGVLSYLLPDMLGSTSIALKADGSVQAVQLFAPFGGTRYSDGSMTTPYNYTGQRLDTTSGLLYYGARYYDATSGRFVSTDTVETNSNGQDTYAYTQGNPETATDPTGHRIDWGGGEQTTIDWSKGTTSTFETQSAVDPSVTQWWGTSLYYPTYGPITSTYAGSTDVYHFGRSVYDPGSASAIDRIKKVTSSALGIDKMQKGDIVGGILHGANNLLMVGMILGGGEEIVGGEMAMEGGEALVGEGGKTLLSDAEDVVVNRNGDPYPNMIDPRTNERVPFPDGDLKRIPREDKVPWNLNLRGKYIKEWYDSGYEDLPGPWGDYDIHHILPREFGGTNDFDNLVPLERDLHQKIVTPWWNAYP